MQSHPPVSPGEALLWFTAGALLLAVLFWPGKGVVARLRRAFRSSERVRMEDALKQLLAAERRDTRLTVDGLAGALGISRALAANTLQHLSERDLVSLDDPAPALTADGREYALRVVRTHRLWERYLADRTGVRPEEWHAEAEEAEHTLSHREVETLSQRLGHPLYDPHGDPIPRGDGSLPPFRATTLNSAPEGSSVAITHIEDEPPEVFRTLTAMGLVPSARVEVLARGTHGVKVRLDGQERVVPRVAAGQVTVRPLVEGEGVRRSLRTLAEVPRGEVARVVGISPLCQGTQRRRLLDLGVVAGTEILPELESAGGDPVAYRIRGALIALRRDQAAWIEVEDTPAAAGAAGRGAA
ncbi:MAG: metal-dependent transcriptional regulator [Gemmatimonadota bacterium]